MKLVWSPEKASKAYIETVKSVSTHALCVRCLDFLLQPNFVFYPSLTVYLLCAVSNFPGIGGGGAGVGDGGGVERAADRGDVVGGGKIATSVGLAVERGHTCGRHVCVVPDERSRSEYAERMGEAGMWPEIVVGEAEEVMEGLAGIDFMVVDSRRSNFSRVLRVAKLSNKGAVLICKNACHSSHSGIGSAGFRWRSVVEEASRRVVRSVFLPVGKGLDIAHVSAIGSSAATKKWIKHVDQESGEMHVIRR
ncbi:hypothetical protein ACSQ67_007304 [Phaseolus vulgaris]